MIRSNSLRPTTSLRSRGHELAEASQQLVALSTGARPRSFEKALLEHQCETLSAFRLQILQLNLGKLCNMTCQHCHVDAGPDRKEVMSRETLDACLNLLETSDVETLDLTGGAPEMNPHFRHAVETARRRGRHVIDRCNLTILTLPRYTDLPEFLAQHRVEIVASLPCYLEENVDRQRGNSAFTRSIEALKKLNQLGYGLQDSGLTLTLVFNPVGPSLPPNQSTLEEAYRFELRSRFGIEFSRLFTITNMPISRFLEDLLVTGRYEAYLDLLIDAFNPAAVDGVMCRNTLSVGWDGQLYDCDFNQMLELPLAAGLPRTIFDLEVAKLVGRRIATGIHCFGCTAGAGSGCHGALA